MRINSLPDRVKRLILNAQSTNMSSYIDIADYYVKNNIRTRLQAERALGVHWNDGTQKVWDIYEEEVLHAEKPIEKAPRRQAPREIKFGYVVRAQKYGYPSGLHKQMRRIASTRTVYFATFENGKITRLQRVR